MRFVYCALICLGAGAPAQDVILDITPSHVKNTFSPLRALGAGVDGVGQGVVDLVYTKANIPKMLSAGWGPLTYRLYTELSVQHWHWNPEGVFSASNDQGYWTSGKNLGGSIRHSHGFALPRRGSTMDQGNNSDYSRLDDGDPSTFWKSNPYLSHIFTKEPDTEHPQWIVVDLGGRKLVDAIRLSWGQPYATAYNIQFWTGGDAINNPAAGNWVTFPSGAIQGGNGGEVTLRLSTQASMVRFVRVSMANSSGTCNPQGSGSKDKRDCVGFAMHEIGIGTLDSGNSFHDLVVHRKSSSQTVVYVSSQDPWHTGQDQVTDEEQPGLDLVFSSGLTRGLPAVVPVGMLYGTPDDAAAEIAYLEARGYSLKYIEMGEEPDGQYILPEDYAALYLQWADALHAVDPQLKLGGPVLSGDYDVPVWPDAQGNTSWVTRFLSYLSAHGRMGDLSFFSYEHYPFNPCTITWANLLDEPGLTRSTLKTWAQDGLPPNIPVLVTESSVTYDFQEEQVGIFGALWQADFMASFLTLGGREVYHYEYEPLPLYSSSGCNSWGSFSMFKTDNNSHILGHASQYFSAKLLTKDWAQPVDEQHLLYSGSSDIRNPQNAQLVTAYPLLRPDGAWAVMLVNRDPMQDHSVALTFHDDSTNTDRFFHGDVTVVTLGPAEFVWHPAQANGYAAPDGPPVRSTMLGGAGATYRLPSLSITILRGAVSP